MLVPFAWGVSCFLGEDFRESGWRREAGKGSYLRYFQFGTLAHKTLGFLDAIARDELIEGAVVGGVDELRQISSIHRKRSHQVNQLEVRIEVRLLRLHPLLQFTGFLRLLAGSVRLLFVRLFRTYQIVPRVFAEKNLLDAIAEEESQ